MLSYGFMFIIIGIVLPVAITSVLSDMNKRKLGGLVAVVLTCCALIAISRTTIAIKAQSWFADGSRLPLLCISAVVIVAFAAASGFLLRRRAAYTLDWPQSTSQGEFQKLGASYLASRSWQIEHLDSFAGTSIYRCRKDSLRMFVLFVRQPIPFDRLLKNISRTQGLIVRNVIVVYFDDPPKTLVNAFLQSAIQVIGYRDLDSVDSICLQVEESRLAPRRKELAL